MNTESTYNLKPITFWISPILCLMFFAGFTFFNIGQEKQANAAVEYHKAVANAMDTLPPSFNNWAARDVDVPKAATELLHANKVMARHYKNYITGELVEVVIVHCSDSRDLIGHYPPRCYPAHGWTQDQTSQQTLTAVNLPNTELLCSQYQFKRLNQNYESKMSVLNFMVLPDGTISKDMTNVIESAANLNNRQFGAMQIQIIFRGEWESDRQNVLASEFINHLETAILTVWRTQ